MAACGVVAEGAAGAVELTWLEFEAQPVNNTVADRERAKDLRSIVTPRRKDIRWISGLLQS